MAMRKPFYVRFVEGDGEENKGGGNGDGTGKVHEHGFPKDTPLVEMSDKEQAAYWKFHARQHESKAKSREDYDQQKADAEKWRQAQKDQMTPDQKAIDAAKEEARLEERRKVAPRLVTAEFKALAGKDVPKDLLDGFLEDVDYTKYLDKNGDVDTEKVQKRVDVLKPKQSTREQRRENHQGYRKNEGTTGVANGRDLFASRTKKN